MAVHVNDSGKLDFTRNIPFVYRLSHAVKNNHVTNVVTRTVGFLAGFFAFQVGVFELGNRQYRKEQKEMLAYVEKAAAENKGMVTFYDVEDYKGNKHMYVPSRKDAKTVTLAEAKELITHSEQQNLSIYGLLLAGSILLAGGSFCGYQVQSGMMGIVKEGDKAYRKRKQRLEQPEIS